MRGLLLVSVLLFWTAQLFPQVTKQQEIGEQADFGAEGDFQNPVVIPYGAVESLRRSKTADDLIQVCAENEGIPIEKIPASWFVASEIHLNRAASPGLVVRGENPCFGGAHIAQFWVLVKTTSGYEIVFRGRADALAILPTRTNGYRDLRLLIVTQAGSYVDNVNFRFRNGQYQNSGHHLEHPN